VAAAYNAVMDAAEGSAEVGGREAAAAAAPTPPSSPAAAAAAASLQQPPVTAEEVLNLYASYWRGLEAQSQAEVSALLLRPAG
jgi:hypothetical protein